MTFIATIGGIYALLALSPQPRLGVSTGLVNLGLAGVFAGGAYASAIAPTRCTRCWSVCSRRCASIAAGPARDLATCGWRADYLADRHARIRRGRGLVAVNDRWLTTAPTASRALSRSVKQQLARRVFDLSILAVSTIVVFVCFGLHRIDRSPYGRALKQSRRTGLAAFAGSACCRFKFEASRCRPGLRNWQSRSMGIDHPTSLPTTSQPLITSTSSRVTAGGVGRPVAAAAGAYARVRLPGNHPLCRCGRPRPRARQSPPVREMLSASPLILVSPAFARTSILGLGNFSYSRGTWRIDINPRTEGDPADDHYSKL